MSDLVEFLKARLDEDEAMATVTSGQHWTYGGVDSVAGASLYDGNRMIASLAWDNEPPSLPRLHFLPAGRADANGAHIARWNPFRVLAEVAAKRAQLGALTSAIEQSRSDPTSWSKGAVLSLHDWHARLLAAVYADHPDYREEWRP